jgi:hypothetical protein
MPDPADLMIYQGDDYTAVVTVTDGTNTPPDLTGYSAQAQMRQGPADANPDVVVEITATINPPNQIQLSIPHDITSKLSHPLYVWDLALTAPNGSVETILHGWAQMTREVTR